MKISKEVEANPYFIISTSANPNDWHKLIEYLAGPVNSTYGALRAKHGRTNPGQRNLIKFILSSVMNRGMLFLLRGL